MRGHFLRAVSKYDPDAQAMFAARAAVGDAVPTAYKNAINRYVLDLKAISGHWASIVQLVVMAGATTINGACIAIKGNNLTPINMVNGDVDIKTGVKGNSTDKYLQTGYSGNPSGTGQDNFHSYGYVTEADTSPSVRALFGSGGGASGRRLMVHDPISGGTTLFRLNGTASFSKAGRTAGDHGYSRGSSSSFTSLVTGTSTTHTDTSVTPSSGPHYILARGPDTGSTATLYTNARILIWALGANVTLADYQTPRATLITALNAI